MFFHFSSPLLYIPKHFLLIFSFICFLLVIRGVISAPQRGGDYSHNSPLFSPPSHHPPKHLKTVFFSRISYQSVAPHEAFLAPSASFSHASLAGASSLHSPLHHMRLHPKISTEKASKSQFLDFSGLFRGGNASSSRRFSTATSPLKDYYSLLGLPNRYVSEDVIKERYQELIQGLFGGSSNEGEAGGISREESNKMENQPAIDKFLLKEMNEAFSILSDPTKRREYDKLLRLADERKAWLSSSSDEETSRSPSLDESAGNDAVSEASGGTPFVLNNNDEEGGLLGDLGGASIFKDLFGRGSDLFGGEDGVEGAASSSSDAELSEGGISGFLKSFLGGKRRDFGGKPSSFGSSSAGKLNNRRQRLGQRQKKKTMNASVDVSFKTALLGGDKEFTVYTSNECLLCEGFGSVDEDGVSRKCGSCKGSGVFTQTKRTAMGIIATSSTCRTCGGRGAASHKPCAPCKGAGEVKVKRQLLLRIPPGIEDGASMLIPAEELSDDENLGKDLLLTVRVEAHPSFTREGLNVKSVESISYVDAILGRSLSVDVVDGKIELKIPPGTQSGDVLTIRNKGGVKNGSSRGDHQVHIKVEVPKVLTEKERSLVEEIRKLHSTK